MKIQNNISILYLATLITFISCKNDKIYQKRLNNNEISIDWYYNSYITSTSPNYIVVRKNDKEEQIFEYGYGLQDVQLHRDTITILHFKFYEPPTVKKDCAFGYIIKYREVSSHEMYISRGLEKQ